MGDRIQISCSLMIDYDTKCDQTIEVSKQLFHIKQPINTKLYPSLMQVGRKHDGIDGVQHSCITV